MDIVVDFDGTCVKHDYPNVGADIGAEDVLRELVDAGHNLILFTMRSDSPTTPGLTDAVEWFRRKGIHLHGIQTNPTQHTWTSSPKAYGSIIIDDAALGCPLVKPMLERPFADWVEIRTLLVKAGVLK